MVERGAVGRLGRILVPWGYWGEDGKIGSKLHLEFVESASGKVVAIHANQYLDV